MSFFKKIYAVHSEIPSALFGDTVSTCLTVICTILVAFIFYIYRVTIPEEPAYYFAYGLVFFYLKAIYTALKK